MGGGGLFQAGGQLHWETSRPDRSAVRNCLHDARVAQCCLFETEISPDHSFAGMMRLDGCLEKGYFGGDQLMKTALIVALTILGTHTVNDRSENLPDSQQFAYSFAFRQSIETQQPLVVIVGAQWCPACRKLENEVIPQIKEMGLLKRISLAIVDYDAETKIAQQLTRGGPIPQVLVFWKQDNVWKSDRLVGYPSQKAVLSFVQSAVAAKTEPASNTQSRN